jgi:hypothetical protein
MAAVLDNSKMNYLSIVRGTCADQLSQAGYSCFDDLWGLPLEFVEPANIRRNGWSGVSRLKVSNPNGQEETFYLKRQENQTRFSLRYLTGALTFRYEADALRMALELGWPSVELVAYAFRTHAENGASQGLLLTRALPLASLAEYEDTISDWSVYQVQLRRIGEQLLSMHSTGWQHGALFPAHLFVDLNTGDICLIDFERARKRISPQWAAYADFTQFIRRCDWLPDEALRAILHSHQENMPRMMKRLRRRFPNRLI